jgi:hypothetical protein
LENYWRGGGAEIIPARRAYARFGQFFMRQHGWMGISRILSKIINKGDRNQ